MQNQSTTSYYRVPTKGILSVPLPEGYMWLKDAAKLIGVDPSTLRHATLLPTSHQNYLKTEPMGRDLSVHIDVLIAWRDRPRSKGGRPPKSKKTDPC